MRKFIQNILAATLIMTFASTVFAQSKGGYYSSGSTYSSSMSFASENEIITNFTNGSMISEKLRKGGQTYTTTTIAGTYLRTINSNVQGGVMAQIQSTNLSGTNETLMTLVGMGVYNFDTNFKQAFFAQAGLGIYPVFKETAADHESKFGFFVGGGKRFPIWGNVNYIPTASLVKKGDMDIGFDVEFINFSIMF